MPWRQAAHRACSGVLSGEADLEILERILAGGLSKMIEAGCTVIGGHSIRDEETKFGYSVTGIVHRRKFWRMPAPNPETP